VIKRKDKVAEVVRELDRAFDKLDQLGRSFDRVVGRARQNIEVGYRVLKKAGIRPAEKKLSGKQRQAAYQEAGKARAAVLKKSAAPKKRKVLTPEERHERRLKWRREYNARQRELNPKPPRVVLSPEERRIRKNIWRREYYQKQKAEAAQQAKLLADLQRKLERQKQQQQPEMQQAA
jgi:hypothetical protein